MAFINREWVGNVYKKGSYLHIIILFTKGVLIMIRHKERIRRTDKKTDTKTHKDRKLPRFTHLPFLTVAVKQMDHKLFALPKFV